MGDLVRSERNGSPAELHRRFNAAVDRQNDVMADTLASPLTITLGDEFQGLTDSLVAAARIAREVRLELLDAGIDCRFAMGLVRLSTPLNRRRAWNMMGSGLAEVRERLDEKSSGNLYRFVVPDDALLETLLEASGTTLTVVERGWSNVQRRDIAALLHGEEVAQIARRRNVTVHTVYKVRASGNFDLYAVQWHAIHQALAALDTRYAMRGAGEWSMPSFTP